MNSSGSVTHWVRLLKAGDAAAAQPLWETYCLKLADLARAKLLRRGARRRVEDEEDAALSAFDSFCRGAARGRFPQLTDRDDLWRLLVVITARKALDAVEREGRGKRGGGRVRGDSALHGVADSADSGDGWQRIFGDEPTPEFAAQAAEECRLLLDRLDDEGLRSIALWKLEGYTNEEIAGRLGCAAVTVERRLRLIRKLWQSDGPSDSDPKKRPDGPWA
jgi:DNA-directed RNA polymerase specialized sigma24 family protein